MAIFAKERQLTPSWDLLNPSVDLLKKNLWAVIYLSFIPTLVLALGLLLVDPQRLTAAATAHNTYGVVICIIGAIWVLLAYPGLIYMLTQAVQGNAISTQEAFTKGLNRVLPLIGLGILTAVAVGIGFILLIVPGLILFRSFYLAPYYLIDQNMGPVEALKASRQGSKPVSAWVWGTVGVVAVFSLLGSLLDYVPLVGVILSTAVSYVYLFGPALRYGEITGRKRVVVADTPAS